MLCRVWDMRAIKPLYMKHATPARQGQSSPVYRYPMKFIYILEAAEPPPPLPPFHPCTVDIPQHFGQVCKMWQKEKGKTNKKVCFIDKFLERHNLLTCSWFPLPMLGCRQYLRGSLLFSLCLDAANIYVALSFLAYAWMQPISMWLFVFQPMLGCRQYLCGSLFFSLCLYAPNIYVALFFSLCMDAANIYVALCFSAYAWMQPISMWLFVFQPLHGCRQYLCRSLFFSLCLDAANIYVALCFSAYAWMRQYLCGSLFFSLYLDAANIDVDFCVFQPMLGCRLYIRGFFCFSAYAWKPTL